MLQSIHLQPQDSRVKIYNRLKVVVPDQTGLGSSQIRVINIEVNFGFFELEE